MKGANHGLWRWSAALVCGAVLAAQGLAENAMGGEARAIVEEVVVNASRAEVWGALTTTDGVTTFFAPNARVELRYGGPYEIYFVEDAKRGERGSEGCVVLGYVPEETLIFTWNAPPSIPDIRAQRTFVIVRLDDVGEKRTRVRLRNGGYRDDAEWDKAYAYFENAWPHVLGQLRRRFDSGPLWPKEAVGKVKPVEMKEYAYFLTLARPQAAHSPTEDEQRLIAEHFAYLKRLLAEGALRLAGRTGDAAEGLGVSDAAMQIPDPFGIVVFEAENDAAARRIMADDPAVRAGIFHASVKRFGVALNRP